MHFAKERVNFWIEVQEMYIATNESMVRLKVHLLYFSYLHLNFEKKRMKKHNRISFLVCFRQFLSHWKRVTFVFSRCGPSLLIEIWDCMCSGLPMYVHDNPITSKSVTRGFGGSWFLRLLISISVQLFFRLNFVKTQASYADLCNNNE